MRMRKACMICELEIGIYTCRMCGRLVCMNHYDKIKGICTGCTTGINKKI